MNHLRAPLHDLLAALSPLKVMGNPIASLDSKLSLAITRAVQALTEPDPTGPPPSDAAYCIGCGTHPKGPYTCATCVAADEHEGEQEHVSDWPNSTVG